MVVSTRAAKKKSAAVAADSLANSKADELIQRRLRREKYEKERERILGLRTRPEKTLDLKMVKNSAGRSENDVAVLKFVRRSKEGALGQNPGLLQSSPQKASQDRVSPEERTVEDKSNNPKSEKEKQKEKVPEKSCENAEKTFKDVMKTEDNAMKIKKMDDRLKTLNDYNYGSFIVALYGTDEQIQTVLGKSSTVVTLDTIRASQQDDGYLLEGKQTCTWVNEEAEWIICFARAEKKLTTFLVESKNVSFGKTEKNVFGIATTPVSFDKVLIPFNFVIGEIGKGLEMASEARLQFKAKNTSNTVDDVEKNCKGNTEETTKGGYCKKETDRVKGNKATYRKLRKGSNEGNKIDDKKNDNEKVAGWNHTTQDGLQLKVAVQSTIIMNAFFGGNLVARSLHWTPKFGTARKFIDFSVKSNASRLGQVMRSCSDTEKVWLKLDSHLLTFSNKELTERECVLCKGEYPEMPRHKDDNYKEFVMSITGIASGKTCYCDPSAEFAFNEFYDIIRDRKYMTPLNPSPLVLVDNAIININEDAWKNVVMRNVTSKMVEVTSGALKSYKVRIPTVARLIP